MSTVNHSAAAGIHPGAYWQSSDPGAVGAGILWADKSSGPPYQLKLRNTGNSAWETVGITSGSGSYSWTAKTANYTLVSGDLIAADTTSGALTMTLPTAVGVTAFVAVSKKTSDTNKVTVNTTSSQTIGGVTSKTLSLQHDVLFLASDGANWQIVAQSLGNVLQLEYVPATDILSATALTATTWTDLTSNQTFTVDDASSLVCVTAGGVIRSQQGASLTPCGVRLNIDSAGTPILKFLGGQDSMGGSNLNNILAGLYPVYLSGLSAGSHTVKLQAYSTNTGAAYCRASTQPNTEGIRISVVELKR